MTNGDNGNDKEPPVEAAQDPLRSANPGSSDIHLPLLLVIALGCLAAGLLIPIMEVRNLWVFHGAYSIVDGVLILLDQGDVIIAALLTVFSILMPIGKILVLMLLWWRQRQGTQALSRLPALLETIGKWSMLDVFVVALVVVVAKTSALADASVGPAIIPFVAAIALTIYCARTIRLRLAASGGAGTQGRTGSGNGTRPSRM